MHPPLCQPSPFLPLSVTNASDTGMTTLASPLADFRALNVSVSNTLKFFSKPEGLCTGL